MLHVSKVISSLKNQKSILRKQYNSMRKIIPLTFVLFFHFALSGCTTPMQKYWLNSQFYQSAQYFEKNLSTESANLDDLYFYCLSLYEIKNYEKFSNCHDTFFPGQEKLTQSTEHHGMLYWQKSIPSRQGT